MKTFYTFEMDCWYGYVNGCFVCDSEDLELVCNAGLEVYFGEVLGKHSEVDLEFSINDFKAISTDEKEIELLSKINLGYNILDYQSFSFNKSDELNEILEKVSNKWFSLEEFINYLKEEGIYNKLKSDKNNIELP